MKEEPESIEPHPSDPAQDPERSDVAFRRDLRKRRILESQRRLQFSRAAIIGAVAGLVAVAFQLALAWVEHARQLIAPAWLPVLGVVFGAIAGILTTRFAPEASGSGIPHIKAVLLHLRPLRWARLIVVKFVGGVASLAAGLSLGREGPTVQMGGAVGKAYAEVFKLPKRSEPQLVASGAGAGLAAAFNAPLAGFLFVIEELQRELSPLTYGTALIASVMGSVASRYLLDQDPAFHITEFPTPPLTAIPVAVMVGLTCGVLGWLFNGSLLKSLDLYAKLEWLKPWMRPAAIGLVVGAVAMVLPEAVGSGHEAVETYLADEFVSQGAGQVLAAIGLVFVAKFALTSLSYGSGAPGGIFAPMLLLGALVGLGVGELGSWIVPGQETPAAFAVLGMAAFFTASVRAPITGVVLIMEMTGNYDQLLMLLTACFAAYFVAEHLPGKPIYEALLTNDLKRFGDQEIEDGEPVLIDVAIESGSELQGRQLKDSGLPAGALIVTIKRHGQEIVPSGATELQPGDHVTLVISGRTLGRIHEIEAMARGR